MSHIEVVLTGNDPKLGKRGEVVKVSQGYAQNFLFPHKKAMPATASNLKNFEAEKEKAAREQAERLAASRELSRKIGATSVVLQVLTGEADKLYGAVTSQDIHEALLRSGISIDKKSIHLEEPIKKLGNFEIQVKLHPEVSAALKIQITKKK